MIGGSVTYASYAIFGLGLTALIYQILALISLARFFASPRPAPATSGPGLTVFKPLKGLDANTRECLASFLSQAYHPYQVLFGVHDPQDPVLPLLGELQQAFPQTALEIVICPQSLGLNPKISTLRQLLPQAQYDLLVIADADVLVGPDFLAHMAAALQEPGVGSASCPYRAAPGRTLGACLEALTISGDFIPSVAVARYVEGIRFALGAAMGLTRQALEAIGGFEPLSDFLADDYQLGWRISQAGFKVGLLPYVVETGHPALTFKAYLAHQLRWARTYRVCRPGGFLAYGLTHALVWSLAGLLTWGPAPLPLTLLAAVLVIRGGLTFLSQRYYLQGDLPAWAFLLLPLKDLLAFGLWLLSFAGDRVTWQHARFRVTPAGKLEAG
jgi:ceramide glucosyltransferase